jgi:hypothetical protein
MNSRARLPRRFRRTTRVPNSPFMLYIIYCAVGFFTATCLQAIAKGVLDPRLPWADTFAVRLRQPVDLVHALKTVKGLLLLVPPRTPRSSGYDFIHMRSMLLCVIFLLHVYVCYVSSSSGLHICVITILATKWWWDLGHSSVHS